MTIPLQQDTLTTSVFQITLNALKNGATAVGNELIMNLIFYFQSSRRDFEKMMLELEENPTIATQRDTEEFYDKAQTAEDQVKEFLNIAKENKDDSEIASELFQETERLYVSMIHYSMRISTLASQERHIAS